MLLLTRQTFESNFTLISPPGETTVYQSSLITHFWAIVSAFEKHLIFTNCVYFEREVVRVGPSQLDSFERVAPLVNYIWKFSIVVL